MRITISQLNLHVGNLKDNSLKIMRDIDRARSEGADLILFPELTISGYPPRDLLDFTSFVNQCMNHIRTIARHCRGIAAVVGGPYPNSSPGGKNLYNAAFFLHEGEIRHVYKKGLLPTYDVFNEYRYFEPAGAFETVEYKGCKLAITVCEDLWNPGGQGMYSLDPPALLARENPDLMINISASPFAWDHLPERLNILAENARRYTAPLFACNLVGGQTDLLFDGVSAVFDGKGRLVSAMKRFEEDYQTYELHGLQKQPEISIPAVPEKQEKWRVMLNALKMGLRDYFAKTGMKKAILGLSGGIDSAVTLAIAAQALGPENLMAVIMPGPYSSDHSVKDAVALAQRLKVKYETVPINDIVASLENSMQGKLGESQSGTVEENFQARARAIVLMGFSNAFGHMLLNTSNKSEAAVGYTTLYGDMSGGLSVLGDVYKTDVYGLAAVINEKQEIIPGNTIAKPPSAELKPNQKDTDSLPPYDTLDGILYRFVEQQKDAGEIISEGFDAETVNKAIRLVYSSEYKRFQSPPILRVSRKCLGIGREMPLEGHYGALTADD